MHNPVIMVEPARIHLAPYLSSNLPIIGLVAALEMLLKVEDQPKEARPIPNCSPIGLIYNPKFNEPMPILTALAIAITPTTIQP
tara:strand:- start:83 stop:334 length:252 start_codon:yes stop_codon:yes gene_type:complete